MVWFHCLLDNPYIWGWIYPFRIPAIFCHSEQISRKYKHSQLHTLNYQAALSQGLLESLANIS